MTKVDLGVNWGRCHSSKRLVCLCLCVCGKGHIIQSALMRIIVLTTHTHSTSSSCRTPRWKRLLTPVSREAEVLWRSQESHWCFISPIIHKRVHSLGLHHCEKSVKYLHSGSDQMMNHELSARLWWICKILWWLHVVSSEIPSLHPSSSEETGNKTSIFIFHPSETLLCLADAVRAVCLTLSLMSLFWTLIYSCNSSDMSSKTHRRIIVISF